MELHQYFKIRGVAYKLIFPGPTDTVNTPVQWASGYSATKIISPELDPAKIQTMATY